jgi:hypothetical protein
MVVSNFAELKRITMDREIAEAWTADRGYTEEEKTTLVERLALLRLANTASEFLDIWMAATYAGRWNAADCIADIYDLAEEEHNLEMKELFAAHGLEY